MSVLFWDIDGTLLSTARAGLFALEDATSEVAGRPVSLQHLVTSGLTDHQIGRMILQELGLDASEAAVDRLIRRYGALLPDALPRRQGRVLPNVREVLAHIKHERPDVRSLLLTGNTAEGARAKLGHYGLLEFFEAGAFSCDCGERSEIAVRAAATATATAPVPAERMFVIGDTPHDVTCSRAIGARTVGVATGDYTEAQLRDAGAWLTFAELPAPQAFLEALGMGAPAQ